ncbi:hypothetical protein DUT91_05955 [Phyllobacterium salinisoli]|uniref:Uncharacterized protein n=1 Tax=Phyllobacterium salinisoli TaxID=1899321 RepID=A0A368K6Z8_9HYPH|nr:hypothetical protein DUT91_05955 [Phyllobacterium salinisoli]
MLRYRFDQRTILLEAIAELLNRGVGPDEIDIYLSRIGPVDLDLFQQCLSDILGFGEAPDYSESRVAA